MVGSEADADGVWCPRGARRGGGAGPGAVRASPAGGSSELVSKHQRGHREHTSAFSSARAAGRPASPAAGSDSACGILKAEAGVAIASLGGAAAVASGGADAAVLGLANLASKGYGCAARSAASLYGLGKALAEKLSASAQSIQAQIDKAGNAGESTVQVPSRITRSLDTARSLSTFVGENAEELASKIRPESAGAMYVGRVPSALIEVLVKNDMAYGAPALAPTPDLSERTPDR